MHTTYCATLRNRANLGTRIIQASWPHPAFELNRPRDRQDLLVLANASASRSGSHVRDAPSAAKLRGCHWLPALPAMKPEPSPRGLKVAVSTCASLI